MPLPMDTFSKIYLHQLSLSVSLYIAFLWLNHSILLLGTITFENYCKQSSFNRENSILIVLQNFCGTSVDIELAQRHV